MQNSTYFRRDPVLKHQIKSFSHALQGIAYNIKTQIHFKFHLTSAVAVIILGVAFQISTFEWLTLILLIALILAAEAINTAVEETCNMMHPEIHPHARMAKNSAAAAVLILSFGAALIGLIIFIPKVFG